MPKRRKDDVDYNNPIWVNIGKTQHVAYNVIDDDSNNIIHGYRRVEWESNGTREYVPIADITVMFGEDTTTVGTDTASAARPSRKCRAKPLSLIKQEEQEEQLKEMQPKKRKRTNQKSNKPAAVAECNKKGIGRRPQPPLSYWYDTSESEGDDVLKDWKPDSRRSTSNSKGENISSYFDLCTTDSSDNDGSDNDKKPKAREVAAKTNSDNNINGTSMEDAVDLCSSDDDEIVAKPRTSTRQTPSYRASTGSMFQSKKRPSSAIMPTAKKPSATKRRHSSKIDLPRQETIRKRMVRYCPIPSTVGGIQLEADRNIMGIRMMRDGNGTNNGETTMIETGVVYKCGGESNFFAKRYRGQYPRQLQFIAMGTSYQSIYRTSAQVFQLETRYKPMVSVDVAPDESTDDDEAPESTDDDDDSDDVKPHWAGIV